MYKRSGIGLFITTIPGLFALCLHIYSKEKNMPTEAMTQKHTNRLIDETSPYLLQHAHNPVDWYPWSAEAFERAKKEDKPVFLSIGYSTCHWCHVMERESFENEEIAEILNEHFVSIKVDREKRPDVDEIYMNAVVMTTGSGGWPLSVFLTPGGKPFYGGTYFPPKDAFGRPGFGRILLSIAEAWKNKRQQLVESAGKLSEYLQRPSTTTGQVTLSPSLLNRAFLQFKSSFDTIHGGFGTAPKFPQPTNLSMLLGYWHRSGDAESLHMVEKTLETMAKGGIYDHLGGGFHRYATDARWLVPHFEKMLYDQALLAETYLDAYAITGEETYAQTAGDVLGYVTSVLMSPEGGFYGAQDADTEGIEGAYYVWSLSEMAEVLSEIEFRVLMAAAELPTSDAAMKEDARYVLSLTADVADVAAETGFGESEVQDLLASALGRLAERREMRQPPAIDDKISADWNGLAIAALARAGRVLDNEEFIEAAAAAADFIWDSMRTPEGRLLHTYRDGTAAVDGLLEDYAFVTYGLIELFQATQDLNHLDRALALSAEAVELFWDAEDGGFFQVATSAEQLVLRLKPIHDGAVPSGNSIAAENLVRLGTLTSDAALLEMADRTFAVFAPHMESSPSQYAGLLKAHQLAVGNAYIAIVVGQPGDDAVQSLRDAVDTAYSPATLLVVLEGDEAHETASRLIPAAVGHTTLDGKAVAYVCDRQMCALPITDATALQSAISGGR